MNYLIDENLPPALSRGILPLHQRDYPNERVVSAREMGYTGVPDEIWINDLAGKDEEWTVVTVDRLRKQRDILKDSGLTWFILARGWSSLGYWNQAWKLVKAWPDIVRHVKESPGSVFLVNVNGKITLSG